jgi:hypothetical protein
MSLLSQGLWLPICLTLTAATPSGAEGLQQPGASARPERRPTGSIENVRFEDVGLSVIHVVYNLTSDTPSRPFDVSLLVSQDGGTTFGNTAMTVTGDIGPGVFGGADRRIVWQAGQDVERLDTEQLQFRVILESQPALEILTVPVGAAISVNGTLRGESPLNLDELSAGEHRITIALDGYLEHSTVITLQSGMIDTLAITLTQVDTTPPAVDTGGGGSRLPLILAIAGGGAAAAVAALSGGDTPPPPGNRIPNVAGASIAVNPTSGAGLASETMFRFTATGVTDADGDSITYEWEFGDGTTSPFPSPSTVTKVYTQLGTYNVRVFATDGNSSSVLVGTTTISVSLNTELTVVANAPWTAGPTIPAGARVTISATGFWSVSAEILANGTRRWPEHGPNGLDGMPVVNPSTGLATTCSDAVLIRQQCPLPDEALGALVGRASQGRFLVGDSLTISSFPGGTVEFIMNDTETGPGRNDNTGSLTVTVTASPN